MKYGGLYWNPKEILPYQRNFNFINSIRNTGKSYSLAGFFIERFLNKKEKFILLTRTQEEKKSGALQKWVDKVMLQEYPDIKYQATTDTMYYTPEDKKSTWEIMGHCRALSEAIKVKKQSFPGTVWGCMDEYMLEAKHSDQYVKGWNEPDYLLNIYHTVDREADKLCMFMLGNNTAFYNPYHLHPAFNIPPTEPGKIWKSENVLFQWFEPPQEMKELKAKNKFLRMIEGTNYGRYALEGEYIGDNTAFIQEKDNRAIYVFSFTFDTNTFGVWWNSNTNMVFISIKHNPAVYPNYVLDEMSSERDMLVKKNNHLIKWLVKKYTTGNVYFESMEVKLKAEMIIKMKMI